MNDTTRWIMIILLLLLIAAAVFMLLRSPGRDNGKDGGDAATLTDRRDADRDGVADTPQGRVEESRAADRGVYDQEADTRAVPVVDTRPGTSYEEAPTAAEVEPAGWEAEQEAAREPVESATYEDTTTAPAEGGYEDTMAPPFQEPAPSQERAQDEHLGGATPAGATATSADGTTTTPAQDMTDVHPLTDDEVDEGGREEPLTRQEQADLTDDRERPVGEESTTYRAAGGEAVVVGDDRGTDGGNWTETHAGPDTGYPGTEPAPTGWDATPADGGTGVPQTADEIAAGTGGTASGVTGATGTTGTVPDAGTDQGGYAPVFTEAAYGPGSAEPLDDGTGPAGWEIKGNIGSMLFHTPESPSYDAIRAEVWFESEEAARGAGFAHWDRRRR